MHGHAADNVIDVVVRILELALHGKLQESDHVTDRQFDSV
jgi:hypothetical protein